jgi:hypothetical protein
LRQRDGFRRVEDIERALQWCFRDELPKRQVESGGGFRAVSPMFGMVSFGAPIDNWSREPGFPVAMGDPHPDAIAIEAELLRLEAGDIDLAGIALGLDALINPEPMVHFANLERPVRHGASFYTDVAALKFAAADSAMAAVMVRAKLGDRPPLSDTSAPEPVRGDNGKALVRRVTVNREAVAWRESVGKGGRITNVPTAWAEHPIEIASPPIRAGLYPTGTFTPLKWAPNPHMVVKERAEYSAWHAALNVLAARLEGRLSSIIVTPPAAAARPWAGDRDEDRGGPGPVLNDLRADAKERERRVEDMALRIHRKGWPTTPLPGRKAA